MPTLSWQASAVRLATSNAMAFALLGIHCAASAQPFLPIKIDGPATVVVATGPAAIRAGKAAIVSLHAQFPDGKGGASYSLMAACDGSWASTIIDSASASVAADVKFPEGYLAKLDADRNRVPLEGVDLIDARQVQYPFWAGLQAQMHKVCEGATPAAENTLFGVARSSGPGNEGMVRALLLGSAQRRGNEVSVWLRDATYRNDAVLVLGKPWMLNGKPQTRRVATERYEMSQATFDCAKRTMAISQLAEYDGKSATPKTSIVLEKDLQPEDVGKGTVAEGTLDAVCRIF